MLSPESVKLKRKVMCCEETSEHYKQTGVIVFIEEKLGFRRSLQYFDITVRFDDKEEVVYKPWMLRDPLEVMEPDTYVEPVVVNETEPTVKKRKKRQSAKRIGLTKVINRTNILPVHSEHQPNQPKEIVMTQNASTAVASTETETAKAARGRPVDPSSAIHEAVNIVRALPVDQRKSGPTKALIAEKLGVKEGTAMVYFYNAIKALREAGEHPVKTKAAPKAKKVKAVADTSVSANAPADDASADA